jgi:hypothetical protein
VEEQSFSAREICIKSGITVGVNADGECASSKAMSIATSTEIKGAQRLASAIFFSICFLFSEPLKHLLARQNRA